MDGTCSQNDLCLRRGLNNGALIRECHGIGTAILECDSLNMRMGQKAQVRAFKRRLKKRPCRTPATPAILVDLEITGPFIVTAVKIIGRRHAHFFGGTLKIIKQIPFKTLAGDFPFAAFAVDFAIPARSVL